MLKKITGKDILKEILTQKTSCFDRFLTIKHKKMSNLKTEIFIIVPSSVSKKAVVRNKIRRRSRDILRGAEIPSSVSLAVFLKKGSEGLSFGELKEKLSAAVKNIK